MQASLLIERKRLRNVNSPIDKNSLTILAISLGCRTYRPRFVLMPICCRLPSSATIRSRRRPYWR